MYLNKKNDVERLADIADLVMLNESLIDPDDKIYLMTWVPDPKQIPDCDFINQHLFLAPYVKSYLQCCSAGLACVEATQEGNPHYHFWYQCAADDREMGRIRWMKVLKKYGFVKITSKVKYYKIGYFTKHHNALHYYKEDSVGAQIWTPCNPISAMTVLPKIDYSDYSFFFASGKRTAREVLEKVSQYAEMEKFYRKSL